MDAPINEAMSLKRKGLSKDKIINELRNKGHKADDVSSAMNQLDIKSSINSPRGMQPSMLDIPEPPAPPKEEVENIQSKPVIQSAPIQLPPAQASFPQSQPNLHQSEQLIESIIDDKWQSVVDSVGDIEIFKSKTKDDLTAIKQEILRLRDRIDQIQQSVLGKVTEYNETMSEVSSEIKALEKVMQNILTPLTSNIKELSRITKDLKKKY